MTTPAHAGWNCTMDKTLYNEPTTYRMTDYEHVMCVYPLKGDNHCWPAQAHKMSKTEMGQTVYSYDGPGRSIKGQFIINPDGRYTEIFHTEIFNVTNVYNGNCVRD